MNGSSKSKAPPNLKTPLLQWMAAYARSGDMQVSLNKKDIRMGGAASSRIAVGLDKDTAQTYIGISGGDDIALGSFPISSIAFARNINDRDWLVIVTRDAADGRSDTPVPLRIWFPANSGTFDAWCGISDEETVTLCRISHDMIPEAFPESIEPIGDFPLTLQGDWTGVEVIETVEPEPEIITADIQMPSMEADDSFYERHTAEAEDKPIVPAGIETPGSGIPDDDLAAAWADVSASEIPPEADDLDDIYAAMDQASGLSHEP